MGIGKPLRRVGAVLLAGATALLAACQPIDGLDLNKAIGNAVSVNSAEGSATVTLHVETDDKAKLDDAERQQLEALKLMNGLSLEVTGFQQESAESISMQGKLHLSVIEIPFALDVQNGTVTIQVEGAKKPLRFDPTGAENSGSLADGLGGLGGLGGTNGLGGAFGFGPFGGLGSGAAGLGSLTGDPVKDQSLIHAVMGYVIEHLPNPATIRAEPVTETVHGESLQLTKVHTELKGSELQPLLRQLLLAIMKDDAGLKALIGQLYDALQPQLEAISSSLGGPAADPQTPVPGTEPSDGSPPTGLESLFGAAMGMLQDKETAVEFLHTEIKQVAVVLMMTANNPEADPTLQSLMSDRTSIQLDWFVDSSLQLRKAAADIGLSPDGVKGLREIRIQASAQYWNVNQPVKAGRIDTSNGTIDVSSLSSPYDIVKNLNKDSALYRLMLDELQKEKISFVLDMADNGGDSRPEQFDRPFLLSGTAMVPTSLIAEKFHADVTVDWMKRSVTIVDPLKPGSIVLSLDSPEANVNGEPVTLSAAPFVEEETVFVPLKSTAELLGASVVWDDDTWQIIVER